MTENDDEHYRKTNICRFCEKKFECDKVRDHCHSTRKYRGPALNKVKNNVTQKHCNLIPFMFHNFSRHNCHLFFKS